MLKCLSIHYNRSKSCLFVNEVKIYQFEAKDSELIIFPFSVDNMKEIGVRGYVYDFSVHFERIDVDIIDIGKIYILY